VNVTVVPDTANENPAMGAGGRVAAGLDVGLGPRVWAGVGVWVGFGVTGGVAVEADGEGEDEGEDRWCPTRGWKASVKQPSDATHLDPAP